MPSGYTGNFRCVVLSARQLVFEGEVKCLFVRGDQGEYELLAYHYPLIGIVSGDLIIDWDKRVPLKGGVIRFFANECTVMIEEELAAEALQA